ncbi:MAG: hypothetical protein LBP39_02545 [Rickettsiales bacterium]|jgi:hypothetical protein|nr:hypothetical protein [Rickettsiales bacterium]
MEDKKTFVYDDQYKDGIPDGWVRVHYDDDIFIGNFKDGEPFLEGTMKYHSGAVFRGSFRNHKAYIGVMEYKNGVVFDGTFDEDGKFSEGKIIYDGKIIKYKGENNRLSKGKIIYECEVIEHKGENNQPSKSKVIYDGEIIEYKGENIQLFEGKIIYDGEIIEYKGENIQFSEGNGDYIISDAFKNKLDENGKPIDKVRIIFRNGNVFEGKLDEKGRPSIGKMMYIDGSIFDGEFRDDKMYEGKKIYTNDNGDFSEGKWKDGRHYYSNIVNSNGNVYEGELENDSPSNISVKLMLSETGKSYCLFNMGKNNSLRKVKYYLDSLNGQDKIVIDYGEINRILNGDDNSKINSLDDLIENGAIEGERIKNFNDLKKFTKELFQDKMYGKTEKGFDDRDHVSLEDLLLLSSVDTVEQLKKTRFQLYYTREDEDSLEEDYESLEDFLESVGIDNIDKVEEDYISLRIDTIPTGHAISVILDIKKMKELKSSEPEKDLNKAVADKKVIHCCYNSGSLFERSFVDNNSKTCYNIGALAKNCDLINLEQQEPGSCWFHTVAATLAAIKHPETVKKIGDGRVKVIYGNGDVFEGILKDDKPSEGTITYENGNIFKGVLKDDKPSEGTITYENGNIFKGDFEDGRPSDGTITYENGNIFKGVLKDDKPSEGTMTHKSGTVFVGKFDENGQFFEGDITCYDGKQYKLKNSQLSEDNTYYIVMNLSRDEFEDNNQSPRVRVIYRNGDVFDGDFKDGKRHEGKMTYGDGIIFDGEFKNDYISKGTKAYPNGSVYIGEWENGSPLDVSVKLMLSDTRKLYCLYRRGRNNFQRDVKYCLKDDFGTTKAMTINYEKINEILNGDGNDKINSLDDLVKKGVIEGVGSFNDLKEFAKEVLRDIMFGDIAKGFNDGSYGSLEDLLLLSSIDTVEQLKKTRFQLYCTRELEDSLIEDYKSLEGFLKSVGIDNINEVEEDYISLEVSTIPAIHGISVILDIKKMKELKKLKPDKSLGEAVASEKVIHCFDSSRTLGHSTAENSSKPRLNMGALDKNCDFVNLAQQELGSCWFHAMAANLAALKYPEIVKEITNGGIELYDMKHRTFGEYDRPNKFQLKQINTIREISERFNIGSTQDGREAIDVIVKDEMKEEVEGAVLSIGEEVLGRKMSSEILKIINSKKKNEGPNFIYLDRFGIKDIVDKLRNNSKEGESEFSHITRLEIGDIADKFGINSKDKNPNFTYIDRLGIIDIAPKLKIDLKRKEGESNFAYASRLTDEGYKKMNEHRKNMENNKDTMKKQLEAENKPIVHEARGSLDDRALVDIKFYGRKQIRPEESPDDICEPDGNKPLSFTEREKKKKDDISEIKQKK